MRLRSPVILSVICVLSWTGVAQAAEQGQSVSCGTQAAWDVDADGAAEIASVEDCGQGTITIRDGRSGAVRWSQTFWQGVQATPANLDAHPDLEIVVAPPSSGATVASEPEIRVVAASTGRVRWTKTVADLSPGLAGLGAGLHGVSVMPDADGDGGADVLVTLAAEAVGYAPVAGPCVPTWPCPHSPIVHAEPEIVGWATLRGADGSQLGISTDTARSAYLEIGGSLGELGPPLPPLVTGVADVSGDGRGDVLGLDRSGDSTRYAPPHPDFADELTASSADGRVMWSRHVGSRPSTILVGRFDGIGGNDIWAEPYARRGSDGSPLWGAGYFGSPYQLRDLGYPGAVVVAGDIGSDGIDDLLGTDFTSGYAIAAREGATGRILWRRALGQEAAQPTADLDGDGIKDAFTHASGGSTAISGADGSQLWTSARDWAAVLDGDADGDAGSDLVGYEQNESGFTLSVTRGRDRSPVWSHSVSASSRLSLGSVFAADVDGDGRDEVVVTTVPGARTYVVAETGVLASWSGP